MEMLLSLPLIFLLLSLVVDMGYGWIIKIKTNTAARFAGLTFIRAPIGEDGHLAARNALEDYYGSLEIRSSKVDDEEQPEALEAARGEPSEPNRFFGTLFRWLGSLGSRQTVALSVERRPPVGTLVSDLPVATYFAVDGGTWTYDEVPLGISGLVDRITDLGSAEGQGGSIVGTVLGAVGRFFGFVFKGFFWMLGMYP